MVTILAMAIDVVPITVVVTAGFNIPARESQGIGFSEALRGRANIKTLPTPLHLPRPYRSNTRVVKNLPV